MKQGKIIKSAVPTADDLVKINTYTRREMTMADLYTFSVVLCDNDIDRDYERFADSALTQLCELYVGKTGIHDHNPTTDNQTARIYDCYVEQVQGQLTQTGDPYMRLVGKAYLPRCAKNEDLILALDSGIKKEVSIGCTASSHTCSICGQDMHTCTAHTKGKSYDGKLCYVTLSDITDAFEWSFVAVPAQRQAGVLKSYGSNALAEHQYKTAIKQLLGLPADDTEISDLAAKITAHRQLVAKKLATADERLITAAVHSLPGYDHKLLLKVMDRSGLSVDKDNNVVGLEAAVKNAAEQYPAVKISQGQTYVPYNPPNQSPQSGMNDLIRASRRK